MQYHSYSNEEGKKIIVTDSLLHPGDVDTPIDFKKTEYELHKLLEKDMKLKWHIVSLSDYWREGRIPRGLRIAKFPSSSNDDVAFKETWEAILNKCSMDLMLLLIEDGKKQRDDLRTKITDIESKLPMSPELQIPFQQKIKDEILKLEVTIKELKVRKFKRDLEDYQRGQVYRWDRPPRTPRPSRPWPSDQQRRPRRVSFGLASSEDERSSSISTEQDNFLGGDFPPLPPTRTINYGRHAVEEEDARRAQPAHRRPSALRNQPRKRYPR